MKDNPQKKNQKDINKNEEDTWTETEVLRQEPTYCGNI